MNLEESSFTEKTESGSILEKKLKLKMGSESKSSKARLRSHLSKDLHFFEPKFDKNLNLSNTDQMQVSKNLYSIESIPQGFIYKIINLQGSTSLKK